MQFTNVFCWVGISSREVQSWDMHYVDMNADRSQATGEGYLHNMFCHICFALE